MSNETYNYSDFELLKNVCAFTGNDIEPYSLMTHIATSVSFLSVNHALKFASEITAAASVVIADPYDIVRLVANSRSYQSKLGIYLVFPTAHWVEEEEV